MKWEPPDLVLKIPICLASGLSSWYTPPPAVIIKGTPLNGRDRERVTNTPKKERVAIKRSTEMRLLIRDEITDQMMMVVHSSEE